MLVYSNPNPDRYWNAGSRKSTCYYKVMPHQTADLDFMREALLEAGQGASEGEVPVGAIVVLDGNVVGRGHNQPITRRDPTAHAEIIAIRAAAKNVGAYRLPGGVLYVTLEPCVMCVGAAIHARLASIRYGARDQKAGALGSVYDIGRDGRLNHRIEVIAGIMEAECASTLQDFFKTRRNS